MKPVARLPDAGLFARGPIAKILDILNPDGEETRVVGGAVRNALMGLPINDVDCATTALPPQIISRAEKAGFKAIPTGIEHGTVTVVVDGVAFEVTTLRRDVETNGRHATVIFGRDFREDAARRDFTINALMANRDGDVFDYFGGIADIAARRVRFIGDAQQRIREDYLRILRLFRFHAHYGDGPLDAEALAAAIRERAGLERLSRERVRSEIMKTLVAPAAADTFTVMSHCGILDRVLAGVGNPARLRFARPGQSAAQRLGLLAVETVADVERLREHFRLSNEEVSVLASCARLATALRAASCKPDRAAIQALIYREGGDARSVLFSLLGAGAALNEVLRDGHGLLGWQPPAMPFTGADVLALGVPPGPRIGLILQEAERRWIAAGYPENADAHHTLLQAASTAI